MSVRGAKRFLKFQEEVNNDCLVGVPYSAKRWGGGGNFGECSKTNLAKTLKRLIHQSFPPPLFCSLWYIMTVLLEYIITYCDCFITVYC